jgi:hypothetical protein
VSLRGKSWCEGCRSAHPAIPALPRRAVRLSQAARSFHQLIAILGLGRDCPHAEIVMFDADRGNVLLAVEKPAEYFPVEWAIIENSRPRHNQLHSLPRLKSIIGSKPDFPAADFECCADTFAGDSPAFEALVT